MNRRAWSGWRIARVAGGHPKVTPDAQTELQAAVDEPPRNRGLLFSTWTCATLARHLAQRLQLVVSHETIRRHLHRLGYRIVRSVLHVRSADPDFSPKVTQLASYVAQAEAGTIQLLFADEVDLNLLPGVLGCWTRRGRQWKVSTPGQNQKRYGFGAVNWMTGKVLRHIGGRKNSAGFCLLLDHICQHYRPKGAGVRVVLVLDNYAIHHSRPTRDRLEQEASWLTVCWLPTYAPQLNPIELVWKHLRRRVTHNHLFPSIEALVVAVEHFFAHLDEHPPEVLTVIGHSG